MKLRHRFLGAMLAIVCLLVPAPALAADHAFADVPETHWAAASISAMSSAGILRGVAADRFAPDRTVSWSEFLAMLSRGFYRVPDAKKGEPWYAPYFTASQEMGLLEGCGQVEPKAAVDRYHMAQVIDNLMRYAGAPLPVDPATDGIPDWELVPEAFRDAVANCYTLEILHGVDDMGTFRGEATMTRAQAAKVMDHLVNGGVFAPDGMTAAGIIRTRENVTALGVALCERLGNGGSAGYSPVTDRKAGQFRYNLTMVGSSRLGYGSMAAMRSQLREMTADPSAVGYVSCCGFALFCWETYLPAPAFYGTVTELAVRDHFQPIIEGDGTLDYIRQHAQPGDLVVYTDTAADVGQAPPMASGIGGKRYKHVEVFLGPYTGVNANGETYSLACALVGSNEPGKNRDVCIKSLEATVAPVTSHRAVYLVSLEKWILNGHIPVLPEEGTDPIDFAMGRLEEDETETEAPVQTGNEAAGGAQDAPA